MLIKKQEVIRDEKHRRFIASLPCIVSGASNVQCAHLRIGAQAGLGRRPSDDLCLPLSVEEHAKQHATSELKYYYPYGGWERARVLARALYAVSGDHEKGKNLILEFKS